MITQPSARLPFDTQGYRHIIYSDNPAGIRVLEEEIPLKIEHFQNKNQPQQPTDYRNRPPKKKDIVNSWSAISNNWEPLLPSIDYKDLRSTAGSLKKRMKQYVYVLSEPESKEFVLEIKKYWPDDIDKINDIDKIQLIIEQVTTILNEWRSRYSTKLNK
jgi:hypothetical protein